MTKTIDLYYKRKGRSQCIKCGVLSPTFRCDKCKTKHNNKTSELRRIREENGLCIACGNSRKDNCKKCERCLEKDSKKTKARLDRLRQEKICTTCQIRPAKDNMSQCHDCLQEQKSYRIKIKVAAFNAYGGCRCSCPNCPLNSDPIDPIFLTMDHVNDDGAIHRRDEFGTRTATGIYDWLAKYNYPPGFQVLCWNCNAAKHFNNNVCPHHSEPSALTNVPQLALTS